MPGEDSSTSRGDLSAEHEARLLEGFHEVIKSIAPDKKAAYLEAVDKAPSLFESECKHIHFIQAANYDLWEAGFRMTEYWSKRKELFGDRALRLMTQVGDGALSSNDLVTLHAGFPVYIPDDNGGKGPIIFADRRRRLKCSSRESLARCFMYLLTVASQSSLARLSSLHMLVLFVTPGVADLADLDREAAKLGLYMLTICPCRTTIHVLKHVPPPNQRSIFEGTIELGMKIFQNYSSCTVHGGHDVSTILDSLTILGLQKPNLPSTVGGDWSFKQFTNWCNSRAMKEQFQSHMERNHIPVSSAYSSPVSDTEIVNEIESIIQSFPTEENRAYLEAMQKAPDLFQKECSHHKFIQACDHDLPVAAKRICSYWNERKDLFGDRAFLPMIQTGDGALTPGDVIVLNAGFHVYIERKNAMGHAPCPIMFSDRRRILPSSSREANWRALFYLLTVASEDKQARLRGLMVMILLITKRVSGFDQVYAKRGLKILKAMPFKVTIHALKSLPKGGKRTLLDQVQTAGLNLLRASFGEYSVHVEDTPGQLVKELEQIGVPNTHVPSTIGGLWTYEAFTHWCRARVVEERASNIGIKMRVDENGKRTGTPMNTSTLSAGTSSLAADKATRKRLLNVMHSRQKRERRKREMDSLKAEKEKLLLENKRLKEESDRLQGLMQEASRVVQCEVIATLPSLFRGIENQESASGIHNARESQSASTPTSESQIQSTNSMRFSSEHHERATSSLGDTVNNALNLPQSEQRALLKILLEREEKNKMSSPTPTERPLLSALGPPQNPIVGQQLYNDAGILAGQLQQLQPRASMAEQQHNANVATLASLLAQRRQQTPPTHESQLNADLLSQMSGLTRLVQPAISIPGVPSTAVSSSNVGFLSPEDASQMLQNELVQNLLQQQQQQQQWHQIQQQQHIQQQQQALILQQDLSQLQHNNTHHATAGTGATSNANNAVDAQRLLILQLLQRQNGNR